MPRHYGDSVAAELLFGDSAARRGPEFVQLVIHEAVMQELWRPDKLTGSGQMN